MQATLHCIQWIISQGFGSVQVLTDSSAMIQLLQAKGRTNVSLCWTVQHIIGLASSLSTCLVRKAPRLQVQKAHNLAIFYCSYPLMFLGWFGYSFCHKKGRIAAHFMLN